MRLSRLALLLVVTVDVMGQGLIFPIVTTIVVQPDAGFLPLSTTHSFREFDYGLVIGVFFLSWFLGAAYVSKISDYIGRRRGIMICLTGALVGYLLTIVSLEISSLWLLILGRAVSGFTAGNQPIAQAALIDVSRDDAEKSRNLGLIVAASALGLVAGPLMAGLLSDQSLLGAWASLELPFYCAVGLVLLNMGLILAFYRDQNFQPRKIDFGVSEVFLALWRVGQRPTVLKLSLVMFFIFLGLNAVYIFIDNYLFDRFGFGTLQNSLVMMIIGLVMALSSGLLVARVNARFRKIPTIVLTNAAMGLSVLALTLNPLADLSYLLIVPIIGIYGIIYPTMLSLFSAAVDPGEQGWVMGVTIALYTLGSGLISLVGGPLMSISIYLPFIVAMSGTAIALLLIATLWRSEDVRRLDRRGG